MHLEEFFNYKNTLIGDLISEEDIVCLIDEQFVSDPPSLVYDRIFPFEFLPDTVQEGKTYLCIDVDIRKSAENGKKYIPTISIWIFTHKSLMKLPQGGVRVDKICSLISKKINGSLWYGQGKLELESVKRFAPMTDYQGKCMVFVTKDVSNVFDPLKKIPSNRRDGI